MNKTIQNPLIFHSLSKNTKDKMDVTTKYTTQHDSKNPFPKCYPLPQKANVHQAVQEWA